MIMPRPIYIAFRIAEMLVGLLSRAFNAIFLGGSTHQTTSARAHIETGKGWRRGRRIINAVFFWQEDHCAWEWEREVVNARKTLERAKGQ